MCGIAGIISPDLCGSRRQELVVQMTELLAHRGPDDSGIFEAETACLGHRRLSIIDLSPGGHQPMIEGNVVLLFNGEIYNYRDLRDDLEKVGVVCNTRSDTEVLLKGYITWGAAIVPRLKGMFAFAIWDAEKRRLLCARDPFGKKPLYYSWDGHRFIFASEIEAVITGLGTRPGIDYSGLSNYLLKGYFRPGKTVYESVYTLKAGCCLQLDSGAVKVREWPYWDGHFQLRKASSNSYARSLEWCRNNLEKAIDLRFQSDVPVGVM